MMRIGLDVMGGDYAPDATLGGAILARQILPSDVQLVLIGDQKIIEEYLQNKGVSSTGFEIVPSTEIIEMGDHPAKAFSQKTQSSIHIGFQLLQAGKIDGFASAGSTGAMMVGAMYTVKSIPGIIRPAITGPIPKLNGGSSILLDVGLNADCKHDVLYQYGILGSLYAEYVYNVEKPKVALLNIGEEEEKGNLLTKASYQAMHGTTDFNFIGNIEGNEIFDDKADVVVCDGFVGNVVLKQAEAFYKISRKLKLKDAYFDRFNFENYGGTPVLGINSNVIIGHGISNDVAIKNMVLLTKDVISANLPSKIKQYFK
ncbi:MAG TPA: phosphate acyltransferase PlsX [Bacteroidales bacterium]|nr:phosphate acyltransferase PlsX [Bacteroidales bacterium]